MSESLKAQRERMAEQMQCPHVPQNLQGIALKTALEDLRELQRAAMDALLDEEPQS